MMDESGNQEKDVSESLKKLNCENTNAHHSRRVNGHLKFRHQQHCSGSILGNLYFVSMEFLLKSMNLLCDL